MAKFKTIGTQPRNTNLTNLPSFNLGTNVRTRKQSYDAFQTDSKLQQLTAQDRKAGVRVYSSLPEQDISATLSRKDGYAIPPSERHKTRERVIASKAHYIANSSGDFHPQNPVSATMLTSCAPNLRKSNNIPENPNDYKSFIKSNGNLNADAYREEMKKVWTRFFFAANEEAKRTGKRIDVITPLAGGGAYLDGLPPAEKEKAKRIIAETMIEAANNPSFQNIGEIHLSIPNQPDGSDSPDFALIEDVMSKSTSQKSVTLSNTDMLTLGRHMTQSGKEIAICNPGSDHVPGGGAYNDRGRKLSNGSHSYDRQRGASPNNPGEFNSHPKALEEQLGQVSNFLYVQNKDQNPSHFDFVKIPSTILSTPAPAQPKAAVASPVTSPNIPTARATSTSSIKFFTDNQRSTKDGTPCYEVSSPDLAKVDALAQQLTQAHIHVYEKFQDKQGYWRLKFENSPHSLNFVNNLMSHQPTHGQKISPSQQNHPHFQRSLAKILYTLGPSSSTDSQSSPKDSLKEIASAVKSQIKGVHETVWIFPKEKNYFFSFKDKKQAEAFAQEIFKANIGSTTHMGQPKTVQKNKEGYFGVYLTDQQYSQLESGLKQGAFSKSGISIPSRTLDVQITHKNGMYQLVFNSKKLDLADDFLRAQVKDGGGGYFDSDYQNLSNSRAKNQDFVMEFSSITSLKNAINALSNTNFKNDMESIVSEFESSNNKFSI